MNAIRQIAFRPITRPLRTTFATSRGSKNAIASVLVRVTLTGGEEGLGEVPTSHSWPLETPETIQAVLSEAPDVFTGVPIAEYPAKLAAFRSAVSSRSNRRGHEGFHMTLSGLEMALFRAELASRGQTESAHWGGRLRRIETDITIPFVPAGDEMERWLEASIRKGFRAYKVKVSGRVEEDLAFVQRVHGRLARGLAEFAIRLDGNQGYTQRTCLRMLDELSRRRIAVELFEQPLRRDDFAGLRGLAARSAVPIILDETVASESDCRRAIEGSLGAGVNIKIAKSGIAGSAAILAAARRVGLKLMIGCMTETMVGLSAGIYLAAGSGAFDYIDLDAVHFLRYRSVPGAPITVEGPRYRIAGVSPAESEEEEEEEEETREETEEAAGRMPATREGGTHTGGLPSPRRHR
jgi:L-Ala-D/L-Glu epimerase